MNGRPLSWLNIRRWLEGTTEFDDIAIAILPIVEGGEAVTDGLEISQAILAYARAFVSVI